MHQIQGGAAAATASSSSSQKTEKKTDEGAKEIALIESLQKDTERGWLFMIAEAMTINQLSWDGAHSLVVDSGAHVHVCPKSHASHAPLQSLPECWRGWDLRSASCKMLKVWGKCEVAYNALDSNGKVLTMRIPFVVCEVRRPLLSLAMLEDKGFHMTVKSGCRILGGHGREMCLRRQRIRVMWMWNSKADCWKRRGRLDFFLDSWLLWPVVWQVFLSLLVWMREEQLLFQHLKRPVVKRENHIS